MPSEWTSPEYQGTSPEKKDTVPQKRGRGSPEKRGEGSPENQDVTGNRNREIEQGIGTGSAAPSPDHFPDATKKVEEPKPKATRAKPKTSCPFSPDDPIPPEYLEYAQAKHPSINAQAEFTKFVNFHISKDNKYSNWLAAWRYWGVQMNDVALTNSQKHFARAVQMGGDNSSLVVLQNRDRSKLAPVAQMNAIAANPQYGRVSFSRTTDTGAPIVSFGSMPDERYQGITDWVMDGGEKIPVTYAVVEADSVLTSNDWSGRAVDGYGDDPTRVHAVAGNGRLAGLNEAFERGTATQYVADMMADRQQTGINPEAVGDLKRPVLVRFMPSEKVTTGFIDRSNQSAVLELSGSERAVQDASKLTSDKLKAYQFDENGEPTRATLDRFVNDIGEPSAIGGLIDGDGKPTEAAKARVMAAVFYKAYRDPELTSLMSVETDKQGMKRVLNAMAAFAPHVIRIREMSGGAIDLGPAIVDAAHMLKSGEVPMDGTLIA